MCAPPGRALRQTKYGHEQNDWPEATWKTSTTCINPETGSHRKNTHLQKKKNALLKKKCSAQALVYKKSLSFCQYVCISSENLFLRVRQKSTFLGLVGDSAPVSPTPHRTHTAWPCPSNIIPSIQSFMQREMAWRRLAGPDKTS